MHISRVSQIISDIAEGFERDCIETLADNSAIVLQSIKEQLYGGVSSTGEFLSPNYDDDPFFDEEGWWYRRAADYKAWKRDITPPMKSSLLGIAPRPDNVPNLYINGRFYSEIIIERRGDVLATDPGSGNGPAIVSKYGDEILNMGVTAIQYFNENYMLPSISDFFKRCGYV